MIDRLGHPAGFLLVDTLLDLVGEAYVVESAVS